MRRREEQPTHSYGSFLAVDVAHFNRPDRTPVDHASIRSSLRGLLKETLSEHPLPLRRRVRWGDTGDGRLLIFPADVQHGVLCTHFIPAFERAVKGHNRQVADVTQLRLRAVLHIGYYGIDPSDRRGHAGPQINLTFRLLDSDFLRQSLARQATNHPVALLVSDAYFHEIIEQQVPALVDDFRQHQVQTKDATITAWRWDPYGAQERANEASQEQAPSGSGKDRREANSSKLIKRLRQKVAELEQQLQLANEKVRMLSTQVYDFVKDVGGAIRDQSARRPKGYPGIGQYGRARKRSATKPKVPKETVDRPQAKLKADPRLGDGGTGRNRRTDGRRPGTR
jgi:hypothetical protein